MRYVVAAVGAIGGTIAARLFSSGQHVLGIARGAHHCAVWSATGCSSARPEGDQRVARPVVGSVADATLTDEDVLPLAVKSQNTLVVTKLDRLARSLPDARAIARELTRRQITLTLGGSVYDPPTPSVGSRSTSSPMVAESDLIRLRTCEGMRVAKAKPRLRGKQPKLNRKQEAHWSPWWTTMSTAPPRSPSSSAWAAPPSTKPSNVNRSRPRLGSLSHGADPANVAVPYLTPTRDARVPGPPIRWWRPVEVPLVRHCPRFGSLAPGRSARQGGCR